MQVRRVATVAALAVVAAGAYAPALAGGKKPITKSYSMQLMPVPDPPQGTPSCARAQLEGLSIHTETLKTTGPGTLKVKVSGFGGDWDISVFDADGLVGVGDGTSTGGGAPSAAGEDVFEAKFKKAAELKISTCNFAGTPSAKGSYTFTPKK